MNRILPFTFKNIHKILLKFWADHCLAYAAALTYATILSLVPVATISFSILGRFELSETDIRTFLLKYFLPESSLVPIIESNIEKFIKNTATLSIISIIALLIICLALLGMIEAIFNHIWQSQKGRSFFNKFVTFWAILTLTPLLFGISLGFIAKIEYLSFSPLVVSFLLSTFGLFFLYRLFPYAKVSFRAALVGSVMASIFFETCKWGFRYYIRYYASFDKIYGTLAVIPISLVWIYWSWVIVLLGAEITFICDYPKASLKKDIAEYNPLWPVLLLLEILRNFQKDKNRLTTEDLAHSLSLPLETVNTFIRIFRERNWLTLTEEGTLVPNTPLEKLSLLMVVNVNPQFTKLDYRFTRTIEEIWAPLEKCLDKTWGEITLGDLVK